MGVSFVTACILCDSLNNQVWDSLQKQCLLGRGKVGAGVCVLCFVVGHIGLSSWDYQQNSLFSSLSQYRLTLILALHCVPDAAGQKAVEPLYTEVYIKSWWMQHVCGLSCKCAFLVEGLDSLLLTSWSEKVELTRLPFAVVITNANYFTVVIRLNMYSLKKKKQSY